MKQLGEILLDDGLVTEAQLLAALDETMARGSTLGRTLVELGVLTECQLVKALANQVGHGTSSTSTTTRSTAPRVSLVPGALCRRYSVLPVALEGGSIVLATSDPGNVMAVDDVRSVSGMPVIPVIATHDNLLRAIDRFCRADDEMEDLSQAFEDAESTSPRPTCRKMGEIGNDDAPIVRFVNLLVTQAITDRASDIHIEPSEHDLRVRYRIDGVLHETQRAPKQITGGVISRVKIMSDIDIAERRKPQDGRMSVVHNGRKIDLRVATLPTVWGEKIVMRILDNSTASLDLRDLSFLDENYETLPRGVHQAVRDDPGHRPDGFGQVHDAVRDAQRGVEAGDQRHHGRGPGRVPPRRHQPGPGEPEGRPDVRRGAALDPAVRPRRRPAR